MSKFSKPKGADDFIKKASEQDDQNSDCRKDIFDDVSAATAVVTNINTNIATSIESDSSINSSIANHSLASVLVRYNPRSIKKKLFTLRLNEYYLEIIRYLSNPEEGVSMQSIIQDIITKELDKRVVQLKNSQK